MNSAYEPLIKLALFVLFLAVGVLISVSMINAETKAKVTTIKHATPFAKSSNNMMFDSSLEQQIASDLNKLTPGHPDYDQAFVNSLLARNQVNTDKTADL